MLKILKRALQVLGIAVVLLVAVVGGYIVYLEVTYNRIRDDTPLSVDNNPSQTLAPGTPYKMATYNIGFGAYTPDYTFSWTKA